FNSNYVQKQLGNSTQWEKPGFFSQRSLSMVETSGATRASLGWPVTGAKSSQCDISSATLNTSSSSSVSASSSSSRYKTELCRSFTENGLCKYGGKCQFAHGPEELRDLNRHPKYKTELCRTFHTIGFCPYGIRCHFQLPSTSSRSHRPRLIRQSFSFSGFPSAPHQAFQSALTPHVSLATTSFTCPPTASSPSCADITDLLSHAFLEMDSAFEASPAQQHHPPAGPDPRSPFMPSPDSGYSPSGLSPTSSPSLQQSPSAAGVLSGPLGARSLSHTSLSDQDQDGISSAGSLSGSESSGGINEANGKRLLVFSQLSLPEDATGFCL
uniref:mRNA decay activator protein ZFP36 n=1 Tax=Neolamprologus brichardi TaxID=32507 RepID=A0A3Q4H7M4_NEOBR